MRLSMEASHKNHRPHIKVGKDTEEEEEDLLDDLQLENAILCKLVVQMSFPCTLYGLPAKHFDFCRSTHLLLNFKTLFQAHMHVTTKAQRTHSIALYN